MKLCIMILLDAAEEDDELSHMSVQLPVYAYTDNELPFS